MGAKMSVAATCAVVAVLTAGATDYVWQGGDGLFSDSAKWLPAGVPAEGDRARFSTAVDGTVTWTGSAANNEMQIVQTAGNTLTLDLGGNTYTLTNRFYFDGSQASSFLVVSNGTFTVPTNTCDVKVNAGVAPARLTFGDGALASVFGLYTWRSTVAVLTGAVLTCNGEVKIGHDTANSESALNVHGGTLTLNHNLWINGGNNSTSTLSLTGGSVVSKKYFSIGNGGAGTGWGVLNLSGGALETQSDVWLGNASSAQGVANVSGGTWVSKSQFEVAHGGGASSWLNMSGGEIVIPTSGKGFFVAHSGNGHSTTGTVSIVGGQITLTNNSAFIVGNASNGWGRCFVGGSGVIAARDFRLGAVRTARGECTVTGGLIRANGILSVAVTAGATGSLRVDQGEVSAGTFNVGEVAGGTGYFAISNGSVRSDSYFNVGVGGTGTLTVAGGSLVMSNEFSIGKNVNALGTVIQTGGDVLCTNNVKIGDWGGNGVYEMSGGSLTCRIGSVLIGNGNGSAGQLSLTGGRLLAANNLTAGNNATGARGTLWMGGELVVSNTLSLGSSTNTSGKALITGGDANLNSLTVGNSGLGDMLQSNGTVTVRGSLTAGSVANSTGTVAVAGGVLVVRGSVQVGSYGSASLFVSDGTLAVSNTLSCGANTGATARLVLAGGMVTAKGGDWGSKGLALVEISGGTNVFSSSVTVGLYTQAVVQISGGSNSFPNLNLARNNAGSSATVTVSGGKTYCGGYLDVGQSGPALLEVAGGEVITAYLRMNPGATVSPVPPQSEIRMTGGRLLVTNDCFMPDTASITGKLTLAGGVFAVPAVRQHHGKLHVLFDGGTVEAIRGDSTFIRSLDWLALTGNGLVVDSAGFAIGTSLVLPDAAGEHGRLVKKGAGTFTLYAANTFTGPVVVEAGELALGASGLITLAGGCEVAGGALLNLAARNLDFTLASGTVSRVDGELRLAAGRTLFVTNSAALGGTGTLGRVVFAPGSTLLRSAADGAALLQAAECVLPAGAVIALSGYTAEALRQGIAVVAGAALAVAPDNGVTVTLDGVPQAPVALRVEGGTLTAQSYDPGTLLRVL